MKPRMRFAALLLAAGVAAGAAPAASHAQATDRTGSPIGDHAQTTIGGEPLVTLSRKAVSKTQPEFTTVTVMPGRGMELFQITANFPGRGEMNVLASPDLAGAKEMLDVKDDSFGNLGYRLGAAFLFPYPNRIIGKLSPDGRTLTTSWEGHSITLPANNVGNLPGAERHAMHGLILKAKATGVHVTKIPGGERVTGTIDGGNFNGHWFSKTDLTISVTLRADAIDAEVTARNVGKQAEPVAIGWHPYFNLPSGDRTQVRVHIPGAKYALVNNYDSVFPTGKLAPVNGTQYDLRAADGAPLDGHYYDNNWSTLDWKNGVVTVRVIDPKAKYGVAIEGISPQIKTLQMYAPPTQHFVAIEDQYNFADPFGKEWHGMDTGMVTLKPGQSTHWHVRVKVFVP